MKKRTPQLVLAALVACLVALPSPASGGSAPVAQGAKKCKKHRGGASTARKKCKKKAAPVIPPSQPVVPPPPPVPASLSISPTSHDFGTQAAAPSDSATQSFTVINSGGSASGTLATSLGGTNPANFVISSDTCNGIALAGGSSCTVDVHCHVTADNGTALSATLTVAGYPGGNPAATLACSETT